MIVQPVLVVAAALFSLGIYGILVRRNAVMVLLSIELILNAVVSSRVSTLNRFVSNPCATEKILKVDPIS